MPQLPPRIGPVDANNFLALVPLENVDFAFMGYLLACHLVIEHYLDEFLMSRAPELTWSSPRLTFSQKAALFPHSIFPNGAELIAAIRHINAIRNTLAHRLETRPEDLEFLPIIRFLEKSQAPEIPDKPLELLELFASTVSAYFTGWLASDAYRTTWRQAKQANTSRGGLA